MQRRILAIDDSLTFRNFIRKALLQPAGRNDVTLAEDGLTGLELAAANPPDLILLDFVLPDISGEDVCRRLADNPSLSAVPVILMSSSVEAIQDTASRFPSVKGTVAKPFTPESLGDAIEQALPLAAGRPAPADEKAAGSGAMQVVFSGHSGTSGLLDAMLTVQRRGLSGVLQMKTATAAGRLACSGGRPIGMAAADGSLIPQQEGLREFATFWTAMDVETEFHALSLPDKPGQGTESMLDWAMESLRHVGREAESAWAWGDSSGIAAYNRSGYERIQRIALTNEEISLVNQVDANSSLDSIARNLGWPVGRAQQVLYRFFCLEIFDFWPASILRASR